VDALLKHLSHSSWAGDVAVLESSEDKSVCSARYLIEVVMDDGSRRAFYEAAAVGADGSWRTLKARDDFALLARSGKTAYSGRLNGSLEGIRPRVERALLDAVARVRAEHPHAQSVRGQLAALSAAPP
jgi:hypothetical protein